jgi:hypothetical protein
MAKKGKFNMTSEQKKPDNFKQLVIHLATLKAIPDGSTFSTGIDFLKDPDRVRATFAEAQNDALAYIEAIKSTGDPRFQDNEVIAGELLRRIKERSFVISKNA